MALVLQDSDSTNGVTTSATITLNTVGSNLAYISVGWYNFNGDPTFTDSQGNTWSLVARTNTGSVYGGIYATDLSAGTNAAHTIQVSWGGTNYPAVVGECYSGFDDAGGSPWAEASSSGAGTSTSATPSGSVTPANDGALIVMGTATGHASGSFINAYTGGLANAGNVPYGGGQNIGCSLGTLIQSTAAAITPVGTVNTSTGWATVVAAFPAAAGGGGTTVSPGTVTHTYTAQAPKVSAAVSPGAVSHSYTGQVPQVLVGASVSVGVLTHTYTGQAPQVQASVAAGAVSHSYTGQVPGIVAGNSIAPGVVAHTYTALAPQAKASVAPGAVSHSYTMPAPTASSNVQVAAGVLTHTYTARAPQAKASVSAPVVTHTYTAQVPGVTDGNVVPVYGWGARSRVGAASGSNYGQRIGSATATDRFKRIGSDSA